LVRFMSAVSAEAEDHLTWRANAPVLYDLLISCALEWPALTVAWLPDEAGEGCRLAIGTHTDGSVPSEVIVLELSCSVAQRMDADPWRTWNGEIGQLEGFGCNPIGDLLRPVTRMPHPTEVNRLSACPKGKLLASKASSGSVLLFDSSAEVARLSGSTADGFALCWSPLENLLASGGNDGKLCVWDVAVAKSDPQYAVSAHTGALCDLSFSRFQPATIASVGDDGLCHLWDARVGQTPQSTLRASHDEVLAVDWSYHEEMMLATGGKDSEVHVWDMRSPSSALHTLKGHERDAVIVQWAPCRPRVLASASADSRVVLWDLDPRDRKEEPDPADDDQQKELLFAHGGHTMGISDFSWSGVDDYLVCSVAEDNSLQIWQPSTLFYLSDSESEPEAKRQRTEV